MSLFVLYCGHVVCVCICLCVCVLRHRCHEKMSCDMFDHIRKSVPGLKALITDQEAELVKLLIKGDWEQAPEGKVSWS